MKKTLTLGLLSLCLFSAASAVETYSWRYFRPGNTGIQGEFNESIWIAPDGNPWISGYDPVAEEGGVAKLQYSTKTWTNISNIDYPVIGTANETGWCRISDMVQDGTGKLWMATWRGALRMDPVVGPSSLVRFDSTNSALPGGRTADVALAPDGTLWFSGVSVAWGGGGVTRYNPATNVWTYMGTHGGGRITAQPKSTGGYFVWAEADSHMERYDSTVGTWLNVPTTAGNVVSLTSKDSTDDVGNTWFVKASDNTGGRKIDCRRPNGAWLNASMPPTDALVVCPILTASGNKQALYVSGLGILWKFNGTAWTYLGPAQHSGFYDELQGDSAGNVWICGTSLGGAVRRDATTGDWQRFRITNSSQYDLFNNDLSLDNAHGVMYAAANAGPGTGGVVTFDGTKWSNFASANGEGLTMDWPFPSDNAEAVLYRPSNGRLIANPTNQFTSEWDGAAWHSFAGGPDQVRQYAEDSLGRVWAVGHYGGLGVFESGVYSEKGIGGWGLSVRTDPSRAGTVWAAGDGEIVRTDGTYRWSKLLSSIPGAGSWFTGMAAAKNGVAWVSTRTPGTLAGSMLIMMNANNNTMRVYRRTLNWPFPGDYVYPKAVTPDGRVWLAYDSEVPQVSGGLCWFDQKNVGSFPGPDGNQWVWGGLPSYIVGDVEVRPLTTTSYELWISTASRGISVLKVTK